MTFFLYAFYLIAFASLALIDLKTHRLPHFITLSGIILGGLGAPLLPAMTRLSSLLGLLVAAGLFYAIRTIANRYYAAEALGFGDVMLAGMIGACFGLVWGLWAIALGMLLGGGVALVGRWRGLPPKTRLPYGLFLAVGALLTFLHWLR